MEQQEQNRSEEPTSFKLQRARTKGTVARGTDLGFLTGLTAFAIYAWLFGNGVGDQLMQSSRNALVAAFTVAGGREGLILSADLLSSAAKSLVFMAGAIFFVVLVFEFIQTGPVFSSQPLKMDFSRMNPATNLKRMFTVRMLVETAKNVAKLAAYLTVTYLVIRFAQEAVAATITDANSLADGLRRSAFRLIAFFVGLAVVFAALDQLIVRRDFTKNMRMSRREVRRELRDREGDLRMKQRRKQLHGEFVKLSQSLRGVRGADVLITNPTHFAVALKYDPKTMAAPVIVSQGVHQFALRLRRLAFLYGVTIVQNPPLARALYRCEINRPVPEALYQAVADIYLAMGRRAQNPSSGESHV